MSFLCSGLFGNKYIVEAYIPITKKSGDRQNDEENNQKLLQFQNYELQKDQVLNHFRVSFAPESISLIELQNSMMYITPTKPNPNQNTSLGMIFSPDKPTQAVILSGRTAATSNEILEKLKGPNMPFPSLKVIQSTREQTPKITPQQYYNSQKRIVLQMTAASLTQLIPKEINQKKQKVFKRIQKSEYDHLRDNHKLSKWEDSSFVRQNKFETSRQYFDLKWKHLDEIFPVKKIALFEEGVRASDIIQGQIGDCYFLSAVAALARNPQRILSLFPEDKINATGIFMTRMIFKGIKQEVTVDSYLPVFINKDKQHQLLGCKPNTNSCEIYTMILEKCWAKLWKSYQKIHGGYPHQALRALTGAVTKNYVLKDQTSTPQKNMTFFNRVLRFQKSEFVMCAGTGSNIPMTDQKTSKEFIDIEPSHIYCVEDVTVNTNGEKWVRIYNPWGHNYIKDTKSSKKIQTSAHTQLRWQEFTKDFLYLTVCKVYDNAHYLYEEMDFKPRQFKFIELTIYEKMASYLSVTVSETDKKQEANLYNPYLNLTYIVVKESEQQKGNYTLLAVKNSSKFSEHYMELVGLQPGKYLIAVYISNPEVKELLTFSVYSEATFGFAQKKTDFLFNNKFIHTVMRAYDKQRHLALTKKGIKNDTIINVGPKGDAWISFNIMVNKSCFGYLLGHVDGSGRGIRARLGNKQLKEAGIRVLPPFEKQSDILLQIMPGNESLLVFVVDDLDKYLRHKFTALKDFHAYIGLKPERFPVQ